MITQFLKVMVIVTGAALTFGCEKLDELTQPDAKTVLENYLDASINNRKKEAYQYLSEKDRAVKSYTDYESQLSLEKSSPFYEVFKGTVSYEVNDMEIVDETATAQVAITIPDMKVIFRDMMGAAFRSGLGEADKEELEKQLLEKYGSGDIPTAVETKEMTLLKEEDGWKVFVDWKGQQEKKARKEKISRLMEDAKALRQSNKFDAAVENYRSIIELEPDHRKAAEALAETKSERAMREQKLSYMDKVILKDFKVSEGERFGKVIPGVFGTIVNNGDKTLKEVEVTVYFLDKHGTVIGEEDFHPVLVTEYSFGSDNKPLKPNYVKDFGYSVEDSAPSSWANKAKAEITNIEFYDKES